uniref:Reverse transcriptase Ty1/copia-type domain-containing protein n=1 Tax=Tanacetum cinerariifolium TaxID=118510 RepID=A0A6L2MJ47_TANCI|nr:hypothetical protein [Tanacetum cinerariifolium]
MSSKAFRVFNKRTKRVEENLHVEFLENKAIEKGASPNWLFDIDYLTKSMNYVPVDAGTISTNLLGTKDATSHVLKKDASSLRYISLPNWAHDALLESSSSKPQDHCSTEVPKGSGNPNPNASTSNPPIEILTVESPIPTVSSPVPTVYSTDSQEPSSDARLISKRVANQEETPSLDNILSLTNRKPQDHYSTKVPEGSGKPNPIASTSNPPADQIETLTVETPIPTISSPVLTAYSTDSQEPSSDARLISKRVANQVETPSLDNILSLINRFEDILGVSSNLEESNGVEANISNMETVITASPTPTLRIHKDHPKSQIIGPVDTPIQTRNKSKEVLKNKKDERGIVIRNKARLVAQRNTQEEGIDYDEVFASVAKIEAIRLFLAYASFMGFTDPESPAKVYKVEKAMYGLHQAHRAWYVLQKEDGIFLSQDKYEEDILKKLGYSEVRSSNNPMDKENPWGKDGTGKDVDLHFYRSMIGSLMYLTTSRPNIMFAICACARHQVTPKECHLHAVKRIFRYLKGHPKLRLWYPKESPFDLVSYSDSDYGGATKDRKSTTGGCQFLGRRDCFEKKLICVDHIRTDENVADLLTKPFDAGRFQYLVKSEHNVDFHRMVDFIEASLLRTVPLFDTMLVQQGEGSGIPTELHHTPSPEAQPTSHTTHSSSTLPPVTTTSIPTVTPSDTTPIRQYTRRARIAQSSILPTTRTGQPLLSPLPCPHDSAQRVTSPAVDEGTAEGFRDDALIKGRNLEGGEAATERASDDTEEMATVLTSMDAATILAKGAAEVPTGSGSIPTTGPPAAEVPTASLVFATATVVTPYRRRKGKEVMVESVTLKKQKVQKQIDAQVARELEEQLEREDQRRKPWTKKQKRDYCMAVIRSNLGWKVKDFKGMTFEEVEAKLNLVWKQMEDFIPIEEVTEEAKSSDEVPEEKVKEMMQMVPIEEVYVEALQVIHPIIDWKLEHQVYGRIVRNKMHKAFPLPGTEFPLAEKVLTASEEGCYCQKKKMPLPGRLHCYQSQEETASQSQMTVSLS